MLGSRVGVRPRTTRRTGVKRPGHCPAEALLGMSSLSRRLKAGKFSPLAFLEARAVGQGSPAQPELWVSLTRAADFGRDS